jgi:DNA repair protein RadC
LPTAHNHPSGSVRPSETGQPLTQALVKALSLVEIRILDHFTIGDGAGYSFAEHRLP